MSTKQWIVAYWDEEFAGVIRFSSQTAARNWMDGYSQGCNAYAGSGHSYLLNDGKDQLESDEIEDVVQALKEEGAPTLEELES